jgi:hypothetical protein
MKKTIIAAVAALTMGQAAFAGSLAPSVMEPEVVYTDVQEQASSSSASGLIIPLILIALIAAAMSAK